MDPKAVTKPQFAMTATVAEALAEPADAQVVRRDTAAEKAEDSG